MVAPFADTILVSQHVHAMHVRTCNSARHHAHRSGRRMPRKEHAPLRNDYSGAPALRAHLLNGGYLGVLIPLLLKKYMTSRSFNGLVLLMIGIE